MSGLGYICEEPPQMCQSCGIIDECRPYGKNYEYICFECGKLDPEMTEQRMAEHIFGKIKNVVNVLRNKEKGNKGNKGTNDE